MLKIHYFEEFFKETLAFSSSSGLENLDLKPGTKNLDFYIHFSFKYRSVLFTFFLVRKFFLEIFTTVLCIFQTFFF